MATSRPPAPQALPPSLVVAKTMLTAALMRADPQAVAKDDIARFHALLDAATLQCSPSNLQNCKEWLLDNAVESSKRIDALGKYLARLAQSFAAQQDAAQRKCSTRAAPSRRRKVLHILYLLNDLLQHVRVHDGPLALLAKNLEPHLEALVTTALSLQVPGKPKLRQRVARLTELYEHRSVYTEAYRERIRKALKSATVPTTGDSASAQSKKTTASKDTPYVLPQFHGEPNDPWYDLPAGALMPHIRPNDPRPINTHSIKAVDLRGKTAEVGLVNAVKDLLSYSESLYNEDEGIVADIDMTGQPLVRDEVTGELVVTEGYYGWSVEFCENMKKRRKEVKSKSRASRSGRSRSASSRSRSRSLSDDRGRSRSQDRKRRYSPSLSRSRSRNRSEKRRRDDSRSYSRPRTGLGGGGRRDSPSRSPYRSRSRSRGRNHGYHRSPPYNRNGSNSSPQFSQPHQQPPPNPYSAPGQPFPPPPPPPQYAGQYNPAFPGGPPFPPPPPPPNYNGWPPPPPPPPMGPNGGYNQQFPPFPPPQPNMPMQGWPGVPPPPPPNYPPGQPWQQQQQQQPYGGYGQGPQQHGGGQPWQPNNGYDRGRGRRH